MKKFDSYIEFGAFFLLLRSQRPPRKVNAHLTLQYRVALSIPHLYRRLLSFSRISAWRFLELPSSEFGDQS